MLKNEPEPIHIICNVCGEDLAPEIVNWGDEHLKKYPTHKS
jgi:hypothetical protein